MWLFASSALKDVVSINRCLTPPVGASVGYVGGSSRAAALSAGAQGSPHHKRPPASGRGGSDTGGRPTRLPVPRHQSSDSTEALVFQQQLMQDCQATKTLLLKLRTVLLSSDTATPFPASNEVIYHFLCLMLCFHIIWSIFR